MEKNEIGPLSHTIYKNQFKMDYRLIGPETVKLLEEDMGKLDIGLGNDFLDMSLKAQETKGKIDRAKDWKASPAPQARFKPLLASHVLTSHWLKQVSWSSSTLVAQGSVLLPSDYYHKS